MDYDHYTFFEPDQPHSHRQPPRIWPVRPCQLRDMSLVAVGAVFPPGVAASLLPRHLTPCEGDSGGFLLALAREGHGVAPLATGQAWLDVQGHDGSAGPCRYMLRQISSISTKYRAEVTISEGAQVCQALLSDGSEQVLRLSVRAQSNWKSMAGVDHSLPFGAAEGIPGRLTVTPWALDHSDAEALSVQILGPDWKGLEPQELTWAALGRNGAMTVGLSAAMPA